jgi:hypothetical protein
MLTETQSHITEAGIKTRDKQFETRYENNGHQNTLSSANEIPHAQPHTFNYIAQYYRINYL